MSMFKVFPATLTPDRQKVPLIKGWQQEATNDQEKIKLWRDIYREKLTFFGVPCGPVNNLLVLDVDVKPDQNGLKTIKEKNLVIPKTLTQKTLSGGQHFIFKYPNDGKDYGNKVKFLPGLDVRAKGGWIGWYGVETDWSVPIADPPQWLLDETLKNPETPIVQGDVIKVVPAIAEAMVEASLEAIREAPQGESNNVLNIEAFRLGQLVASQSITREYAEAALFRAAKERGKPDYEAKATIRSGLDGGMKKPLLSPFGAAVATITLPPPPVVSRYTPQFFTKEDLLNTSRLRKPQLFENWSTEDISITTADGGTGKTTLKLQEAICLALGERFLGFNCLSPGSTLFITGEDTDKKLGAMLGQIVRQMGLFENPMYNEKIETILKSIVVKKDSELCLVIKDRNGFFQPNKEALTRVLEAVEDIRPRMIVFDPISSFWGSEAALNDMAKAVAKFMQELQEKSHACVEMINHMGKVSSQTRDMSQFAGRGGTGLPSHSRVSRVLRPVFDDEYTELTGEQLTEKQSAILCNINKFSDGSPLYNKPFLILRDGFLFSRKNLSDAKAREAEKQLSDVERVFGFIKESRGAGKYATEKISVAYFATCGNPIPGTRVKRALELLAFQGHMGELIKLVDNPDLTQKDKVYVITDMQGVEG